MTKAILRTSRSCSTTAPLEADPARPEADLVAVHERRLADALAVHLGAVGRLEVDQRVGRAGAPDLGVAARDVGVVDAKVALARAPDHGRRAVQLVAAAVPFQQRRLRRR